ncbi:hypothetical protein JAAARDRAFT_37898 [Jaapia argillacea MUCL 33604]|uniref:Uncharacterized protein n=1 Tax=Jaapia argillacea MUCL 33604 TaxID=933084 RepID=A0A067PIZ7_9AGAM|nr:hypothetical protein JAAARDRAFT_37898 [Jaapia argillacea MUCL 33604]
MSKQGKKRASPGADFEKNPLGDVELSDEDARQLEVVSKDISRAELILERNAQKHLLPVYEKRRTVTKAIPKFWPVALLNHPTIAMSAQHNTDQIALSYLEDVWITREAAEPRCFSIQFTFKENPYFTDSVLVKDYQYVPSPASASDAPDADGITPSMLDFSWERDVSPKAIKIKWKDDAHNLTKLYPRQQDDEDDDMPAEPGSIFNFFETAEDPFDLGVLIANDIFPEAIDYFLGHGTGAEDDSDDEDDDDSEEDEIDLEKPRPKKHRHA